MTVSGLVLGLDKAAVEAELKVERQGANAMLEQRKHLDITPGARVVFGTMSVSFAVGDDLVATVILRSGGAIIAETRTIIGGEANSIPGGN